ncbi:hypothetical protein ABZ924_27995 [Streptomyces sp. NPDC046876]|uniref:hypothetical protein n=1 Tax=Streptomyces sp. NPDC046876 TaxID=3155616 RepID=UPI003400A0A8
MAEAHWTAHPQRSRDSTLRHPTPDAYLLLALNTYRVVFTRGTHTTLIHSTDPDTHQFVTA